MKFTLCSIIIIIIMWPSLRFFLSFISQKNCSKFHFVLLTSVHSTPVSACGKVTVEVIKYGVVEIILALACFLFVIM